jgi:hypothetical protein
MTVVGGTFRHFSSLVDFAKLAAVITSSFFSSEVRDRVRSGGAGAHQLYSTVGMPASAFDTAIHLVTINDYGADMRDPQAPCGRSLNARPRTSSFR